MTLTNRRAECDMLDRLVEAVRAGESRALVLSGEAGVGKTALLDYLAEQASECHVIRAAGVQSEMEVPFAVLHQLCASSFTIDRRRALRTEEAARYGQVDAVGCGGCT